jgi:hypothetical protein
MHTMLWRFHQRFHEARAALFLEVMTPQGGQTLLDLGGSRGDFAERICGLVPLRVTVADLDPSNRTSVEQKGFRYVTLSGEMPLPFETGEFDYVLSNSVIEHVTLDKGRSRVGVRVDGSEWREGSEKSQHAFAAEVRRVGRGYFVQTPHKHFPVDPHIYLPFVQYLSHNATCRLVSLTDRWWLNDCSGRVDWHLLTPADMRRLFPDGEIRIEKCLGVPKSIVATRRPLALRQVLAHSA